ncbi:hypothetical protein OS493_023558 [Desmophyllum pertusum]|uniref:G-protein coupled receptors family 1 profile domain-containing protein n=1 Tax=Desmophyllum pertusum TaxID=174260 RepID=A0A9X0CWN2_9CNID|nr:hypothetical protein OS493_023558 [Desmophyllum pertusum]
MWISIAESQRENTSNHNETEPGACCVWMSIAEDNTPNHNKTVLKKDPQDFPEIIYSFPTKVIFTSAVLFTFLVSVVGNSLVIYVITKHHLMRTSTNCLIMNLAICDLLLTVIQTPFNTLQLYYGLTWFGGTVGNVTLKITAYVLQVLLFCSILNLVAIAIDRFLAVTRPLTYKLSSKWVVKIGIPVIWLIPALLSIKTVMSTKIVYIGENETPKRFSKPSREEGYASASCLVVSLVILIVLYSIICYRLWRRKIPGEVSNNQHALAIRTARKVTVLMISVVIVFVVSWAPVFVFVVLSGFNDDGSVDISVIMQYPFLLAASYWLLLNSSACNPCLYFIFIESYREGLKTACSRCRPPEFRVCRIGQERQFETEEPMRNRQTNILTQEEGAIELTAYSTVNHRVAPL